MSAVLLVYTVLLFWLNHDWLVGAAEQITATSSLRQADARLIVWVLDWVYICLTSDWSSLLDAPINFPAPAQLTGSEHFAGAQLIYAPIRFVTGDPIVSANLTAMLCYPIGATAMYAFLTAVGVATLPAFAGGLALALGPYQTPGQLHILQYLPLFFPLCALALLRLRQSISLLRTVLLMLALVVGMTSSYYTAMMLCAASVPWAAVEIGTAPRSRGRLALAATLALAAAIAILVAVSLPYIGRANAVETREIVMKLLGGWTWDPEIFARYIRLSTIHGPVSIGVPMLIASSLGFLAYLEPDLRRYLGASLATAAVGLFLFLGGTSLLDSLGLPAPLSDLASLANRFFSIYPRAIVIVGFCCAVLAGIGLETARRRSRGLGNFAALVVVFALLVWRGTSLANPFFIPVDEFTIYRPAYERVGHVIAARGGGPLGGSLLELPRGPRAGPGDSRSMLAQLVHRAPLITGHTGYLPRGRAEVDELIRQLPENAAMHRLIEKTALRWILLRPMSSAAEHRAYERFVRQLRLDNWVRETHGIDGMLLIELREHPISDERWPWPTTR